MLNLEESFYETVAKWFKARKKCSRTETKHNLSESTLLNADVIGWATQGGESPLYACELKAYPLPVGAGGYGAIGQALSLRRFVPLVYVGCVASEVRENVGSAELSWQEVMAKSSVRNLMKALGIETDAGFDGYLKSAREIFQALFGSLGLGLLIVHERSGSGASEFDVEVVEVVEPSR